MFGHRFVRRLAAGALALYGLVVGVLLPLHALLDVPGPRSAPVAGVSVEGDCQDRDCHEPTHRHHAHVHDPATCVSCAQAKAAVTPAPVVAGSAPLLARVGAASRVAVSTPLAAARAVHPARGPPALS
jgi:hypothetical protein